MCKSWCEAILGIIILIFTYGIGAGWGSWSAWVVYIAAIVLIIHSFTCNKCFGSEMSSMKTKRK